MAPSYRNPDAEKSAPFGASTYGNRVERWIILEGNRLYIAGIVSIGIFVGCIALTRLDLITLDTADPIVLLLSSLIGGMLPFITVVLAIVQLILSQEFGSTGTFRDRLEETETFRNRVETDVGMEVSPVEPERFLDVVIEATRERAVTLREQCNSHPESRESEAVERFVRDVIAFADGARRRLEGAEYGSFEVMSVLLEYNDSRYLYTARRLKEEYADDSSAGTRETLGEIEDLLEDIHITRQYFKIVQVQQELADLSRWLLYVGFPALVGGGFFVLIYNRLFTMGLGEGVLVLLISLTVAMAFAPFTVLLAYILRVATIARRTAADFGPFHLQKDTQYVDWEE